MLGDRGERTRPVLRGHDWKLMLFGATSYLAYVFLQQHFTFPCLSPVLITKAVGSGFEHS